MIIATYNVEFLFDEGEHQHSGQTWIYTPQYVAARVDKLAGKIKEISADVLLLQEVGSSSVVQKIIERCGTPYTAYYGEPDRFGVGNAVLYRLPAKEPQSIDTTTELPVFAEGERDNLSPHIQSRRSFVHVVVDYHNRPLHVIGQHIKANFLVDMAGRGDGEGLTNTQVSAADALIRSEIIRMAQAKKLRQIVDTLLSADPQAQIVVGGDFNATKDDTVYRIVKGVEAERDDQLLSAISLADNVKRFDDEADHGRELVDDILYSPNLSQKVQRVRILYRDVRPHKEVAPYRQYVDSDHAPIVVELS